MTELKQQVQVEYKDRTYATGKIDLTFRTPDGSRVTQTMAPGDVATLSLMDAAFIDPEAEPEALPVKAKGPRERAYELAETLLAATGDPDQILALAMWLAEGEEG